MQQVPCHYHCCAGKGGNGVKVGTQDGRYLGNEHIAHHAATDPSQHSEKSRHYRIEAEAERLLRSGHGEKRQSCAIEDEDGAAQLVDGGKPVERDSARQKGNGEISPIGERRWRNRADHEIASDASKISCNERQDENAEYVEPSPDPSGGSAEREDKRPK